MSSAMSHPNAEQHSRARFARPHRPEPEYPYLGDLEDRAACEALENYERLYEEWTRSR